MDVSYRLIPHMLATTTAFVLTVGLSYASASASCFSFCEHAACDELNGDVVTECGGCPAGGSHACAPGQPGYGVRAASGDAPLPQLSRVPQVPVVSGGSGNLDAADVDPQMVQACQELTGSHLRQMEPRERAAALQVPTLVSNLTDTWPTHDEWLRHFSFDGGHPDEPPDAARKAARSTLTRIFDRWYGHPSPFHQRSVRLRISYSNRGGGGVSFCNHGFSWLALRQGTKVWFFAPHGSPAKPEDPSCAGAVSAAEAQRPPRGATHQCVQRPGTVIVVPTAWWHATCNFGEGPIFAFGGEDDCDVRPCEDIRSPSTVCLADDERAAACHGDEGARHAEAINRELDRHGGVRKLEQSILTVSSVDQHGVWETLGLPAHEEL